MVKKIAALAFLALTSCFGEWDVPKVPRRDPCSGVVEDKYVYFMPQCPYKDGPGILIRPGDTNNVDPGGYKPTPPQLRQKPPL